MAGASDGGQIKRSRSYEFLPPALSELRVVLLGSSWSQRSSVGNFILGVDVFKDKAQRCLKISGKVNNLTITVINTPDLQFPTANKLTQFIKDCVRVSAPGPHVFLLVVQPEDFTMKEKNRICTILEMFNDQSFDHLLLSILKPRQKISGQMLPIKQILEKCSNRYLKMEDIKQSELLSHFKQIVQQNSGEHVIYEGFEDAEEAVCQSLKEKAATGSDDAAAACGFGIVLLGKSEKNKAKLGNFILGGQEFHYQKFFPAKCCVASCGEWSGKPVTVVKTPDMSKMSEEKIQEELKTCVSLCPSGPNVLLLLVKPSEFAEKERETLISILSLFGQEAFKHSMVILTHDNEISSSVKELLRLVQVRCYNMNDEDRSLLMKEIEIIVHENKGTCLTYTEDTSRFKHGLTEPSINLVLFGRRGSGKTSAAKAILGQIDLHSASSSSDCVRNQGEVHGRWVSVVELPALNGKAQQEVMEESFRCISLCDPEGVHAFILVLPVGPLTDEDKGELQTIQDTFSSRVNDFTIILFTTESDPTDPDCIETDRNIQELLQGCGGRYVVLNIKDSQQIPELMETVEMMINEQSRSFSKDMFTQILIERTLKLKAELQDVKPKSEKEGEDEPQSKEPQRKETVLKEKDRDEIKALQAKLEQERKQKIQLLKEKESMKKECEKIKKEREEEERKWKRKEESQRKEWQQKVGALEKQKEAAEKKLEQSRREWVREREALEKEKDKIWERMHEEQKQNLQEMKMNLEEERKSHRQLQEEHYRKRRKWTYVWFASLLAATIFHSLLLYLYQSR